MNMLWFAIGCNLYSLPEVPIEGGTHEQRDAALEQLILFDEWVGYDRLQIFEVRFENLEDPAKGWFQTNGPPIIRLDEALETEHIDRVLRHELCHALDYNEGLVENPSILFNQLVDDLDGLTVIGWTPDERDLRSEVLAEACNVTPSEAWRLATLENSKLYNWILLYVWKNFDL